MFFSLRLDRPLFFYLTLNKRSYPQRVRLYDPLPARGALCEGSGRFRMNVWLRHPHDSFGNPVCFLLVDIIGFADPKLCLEDAGFEESFDCSIADRSLEVKDLFVGRGL